MACPSSSSIELCEASNVLLMTLMEEEATQEDHYYQNLFEDERLVDMIQSFEAEINSRSPLLMEHVDGQDCSTSSSSAVTDDDYDWVMDMEVVTSISSYDDLNDANWSAYADMNGDYFSDNQFNFCGVSWVASDAEL